MGERSYSKLDPVPIRATIERLQRRIEERFPESGLSRVSAELTALARENEIIIVQLRKPLWWLRVTGVVALIALTALALWVAISFVILADGLSGNLTELLQGVVAALIEVNVQS